MLKKLYAIGTEFSYQTQEKNISAYASGTAFFFFLSFIPMLIMICSIIPFTPLTEEILLEALKGFIPIPIFDVVANIVEEIYDQSAGVLTISAIGTIWSAGKGTLSLMQGLNEINDVSIRKNYIIQRLVACLYTVLMIVLITVMLILTVFGKNIWGFIKENVPIIAPIVEFFLMNRILLTMILMAIVFALLYSYIPGRKNRFVYQLPGALVAGVAWEIFSMGFSIYATIFAVFSTYGSLTTIIIAMLWLYAGFYIILIGAEINKYFYPVFQVFSKSARNKRRERNE